MHRILMVWVWWVICCASALAQHIRPDWRRVSQDAYMPDIILVRLSAAALQNFSGGELPLQGNGFPYIEKLDAIWKQLGLVSYRRVVDIPLRASKWPVLPAENNVLRWIEVRINSPKQMAEVIASLEACKPWVEMAEPRYTVELYDDKPFFEAQWFPGDTLFNRQWHYHNTGQTGGTPDADIDLPEAWEIEKGHPSVIVAVGDNGIDTTHIDLRQNLAAIRGYNFFNGQSGLVPGNHGNHTAGTIGAVNNNVSWVSGIAGGDGTPGSGIRLMSCQIFGVPSGSGGLENAFVWAAQNGAAISSNSWGYTQPNTYNQSVLDAIDFFIEHGGGGVLRNGLVVFSGGNGGDYALRWPGAYHKVIGVSATNHDDIRSWYSTYNEELDIAAPGGETSSGGGVVDGGRRGVLSTIVQAAGSVGYLQGTSMAAPHVSGVAALVASNGRGRLSADDVKSLLLTQTDEIDSKQEANYRGRMGTGRLNAFKALNLTHQLMQLPVIPAPVTITATVQCRQIELQWQKANASDEVLVAVSTAFSRGGLFGIPAGSYNAGDTLTGGGRIVYRGTANGYTYPQATDGKTYFFKIWTIGQGGAYSMGVVPLQGVSISSGIDSLTAAVACYDHTDLAWKFSAQCDNTPVLLAYSPHGDFGEPTGIYQPGDMLGGSVILFSGQGNQFRHILTGISDSANLYYRIWPMTGNGAYGSPVSAIGNTPAAISRAYVTDITQSSLTVGWQRHSCFSGEVLVAWNTTGQFPQPSGDLQPGESFGNGGATVLYRGSAPEVPHPGLQPNTLYYYAVWPVLLTGYGLPRYASGRTRCSNEVIRLPFRDTIGPGSLQGCLLDTVGFRNFTAGPWPQLKVVTNGTNPTANPFSGGYMLAFNSFDTRATNEVWLTTPPLNTTGLALVDVAFKWYEDGSDYTGDVFASEGVSLYWSVDYINWQKLETYPRIPPYGGNRWKYKQATLPAGAANQATLYVRWKFTSAWGLNCYLDEIAVIPTNPATGNGQFARAMAEHRKEDGSINYYDAQERLLLTAETDGQDIGHVDNGLDLGVGGVAGALRVNGNGNYVRNSGGWASLGKYWHVESWSPPARTVQLSMYLADSERIALQTAAATLTPPVPTTDSLPLMAYNLLSAGRQQSDPSGGQGGVPVALRYGQDGYWQHDPGLQTDSLLYILQPFIPGWSKISFLLPKKGGGSVGAGSPAGNGALLPHWEGLGFSRSAGVTEITWSTGYERNWMMMQVERATLMNRVFSPLGLVPPVGWPQSGGVYSFTDGQRLPNGSYLYRIRATDKSGRQYLSPEAVVVVEDTKGLLLFPNPATNGQITIFSESTMKWLRVVDALGRKVYEAKPMATQFTLKLPNLATGLYFVQAEMDTGVKTERLLIGR